MPDFILNALLEVLKIALPPVIVKFAIDLAKKLVGSLSPRVITAIIVPALSAILSIVNNYMTGANPLWTFLLGMLAITFNELLKYLKPQP